jgi:hypothetical protein
VSDRNQFGTAAVMGIKDQQIDERWQATSPLQQSTISSKRSWLNHKYAKGNVSLPPATAKFAI